MNHNDSLRRRHRLAQLDKCHKTVSRNSHRPTRHIQPRAANMSSARSRSGGLGHFPRKSLGADNRHNLACARNHHRWNRIRRWRCGRSCSLTGLRCPHPQQSLCLPKVGPCDCNPLRATAVRSPSTRRLRMLSDSSNRLQFRHQKRTMWHRYHRIRRHYIVCLLIERFDGASQRHRPMEDP